MDSEPVSFKEPNYTYLKEGDVVEAGDQWEFRPGLWEAQSEGGHVVTKWEGERKRYRREVR